MAGFRPVPVFWFFLFVSRNSIALHIYSHTNRRTTLPILVIGLSKTQMAAAMHVVMAMMMVIIVPRTSAYQGPWYTPWTVYECTELIPVLPDVIHEDQCVLLIPEEISPGVQTNCRPLCISCYEWCKQTFGDFATPIFHVAGGAGGHGGEDEEVASTCQCIPATSRPTPDTSAASHTSPMILFITAITIAAACAAVTVHSDNLDAREEFIHHSYRQKIKAE